MTVITVANIEWPTAATKPGKVTDSTGKIWGCFREKLSLLQPFQTYDVTFSTREYMGKTYHTITGVTPVAAGAISAPAPAAPQVKGNSSFEFNKAISDEQRRMDIFVCGAFNNIMGNPNNSVKSLAEMIQLARQLKDVWRKSLGPGPDPMVSSGNEDMDGDGIPY